MKRFGKITVCLAGLLAMSASARAGDAVSGDNPYAPLVIRNIFGLNPPVPVDTSVAVEPPVKITPNGIMSISGQVQVLFKVAGKAGGKESSYILTEGQRQDDIEIVQIDEKKGLVTFNNHGVVQQLALVVTPAATGAASGPSTMMPGPNSIPAPTGGPNGGNGISRFGGRGGNFGGRNRPGNGTDNAAADGSDLGSNLRSVPTRNGAYQPAQEIPRMSPEEQAAAIIINTEKMKAENNPAAPLMPPVPGF